MIGTMIAGALLVVLQPGGEPLEEVSLFRAPAGQARTAAGGARPGRLQRHLHGDFP